MVSYHLYGKIRACGATVLIPLLWISLWCAAIGAMAFNERTMLSGVAWQPDPKMRWCIHFLSICACKVTPIGTIARLSQRLRTQFFGSIQRGVTLMAFGLMMSRR